MDSKLERLTDDEIWAAMRMEPGDSPQFGRAVANAQLAKDQLICQGWAAKVDALEAALQAAVEQEPSHDAN